MSNPPILLLLPGIVKQNQPWILFALPVWLALAWSLRRVGARPVRERSGGDRGKSIRAQGALL